MDLLYAAAKAWSNLLQYRYLIICGKSKKLYPITLEFKAHEFYHLAGFPHIKDITFPTRFSQTKMLGKVLDGSVTQELISKSSNYKNIVERKLYAIINLERLLNNCPDVYLFNRSKLPVYSEIDAKYLFVDIDTQVVFLFTDTEDQGTTYFSRSAFVMDNLDFRSNQSKMTVLKIQRANISTGEESIIFRKDGFIE